VTNPNIPSLAFSFKPGDKLAACFTLKELLPPQALCCVWLAHDDELDKDILLQFVPDSVATDTKAMAELKNEAKRNRQLIHPNIVRVHDLITDEKWAAVSMDYVPGDSYATLLEKREKKFFNPAELTGPIATICQTLEDAHRIELFHRDLAPDNLIAGPNGLMVRNFGITRVILDALARTGQQIEGSRDLAYISPQQLDGERPQRTDDVYSLGATLYHLLTGAPPFSEGEVVPQIRKNIPQPVSERRAARGINAEPVAKNWDDTIAACLAKTAEERVKTAAEVAVRLDSTSAPAAAAVVGAAAAVAGAEVTRVTGGTKSPEASKAAGKTEPAKGEVAQQEIPAKGQKRPWTPGPGKAPVITEATVISTTPVAKGDRAESKQKLETTGEPGAKATETARKVSPGPTTPTGFPLRAFVEVEGEKRQKPRSSAALIAGIAVLALVAVLSYIYYNGSQNQSSGNGLVVSGTVAEAVNAESSATPAESATPTATPQPVNLAANSTPSATPETTPATTPATVADNSPAATPAESAAPTAAPETQAPSVVAESPAPSADVIAGMTDDQVQQLVGDKSKAVDQAKAALAQAEKDSQDKADAQKQATATVQDLQSQIQKQTDAATAAKKASDDLQAAMKDLQTKAQDAQTASDQAQTQLGQRNTTLADRQKAADAATQAATDAEKNRQTQAQSVQQAQATLDQLQANAQQALTAIKARQAAQQAKLEAARQAQTEKLEAQAAAAAKAAADAEKALEAAKQAVADAEKAQAAAEQQAEAAKSGALPIESGTITPVEALPSATPETSPAPEASPSATPAISAEASPSPNSAAPTLSIHAPNPNMKVDQALSNSLGMRFAPVGKVFFSIWLTRVQDFEAFAKDTGYKGTGWLDPGFKQGSDHPVVNLSWNDANQFCLWLTQKEHHEGILDPHQEYRLPTDLEWSNAVGLPHESGRTPESRDMDVPDVYPWGTQWPPPSGAGNYTGEETDSDVAIKGYNDGFAWTSPVGSFNANKFGLFDMGGNVWEWCQDWWNDDHKQKVLRGASWYNGALRLSLLSSCRIHAAADGGTDNYGFRVVLATMGSQRHAE
jgi:formylglycine-generating enzyme required for sulfatase activity